MRRGGDAPGFHIRGACVAHGVTLSMPSASTFCAFVQEGALVARIKCIECVSAHVFGMRSRAHLHVGCARTRLYERSRNCVHHRPSVKSGTKSGPRSGNTILARVARRCKRGDRVLLVLRELFWDLHTCEDHYQHNLRTCSTTLTLLKFTV